MPISDDITDNLTVAVARWVTAVAREVVTDLDKAKALDACLNAEEADLRVTLRLCAQASSRLKERTRRRASMSSYAVNMSSPCAHKLAAAGRRTVPGTRGRTNRYLVSAK